MTCKLSNMHVLSDTRNNFKYVVTSSPDSGNIESYKNLLLQNKVTTIIRLCDDKLYDDIFMLSHGIQIIHIPIQDGGVPDSNIVESWIKLIVAEMEKHKNIAVHCKSGLGRAPMFACIGLIQIGKMDAIDAIQFIRKHIPGALNTTQINYLCNDLKKTKSKSGCCIM